MNLFYFYALYSRFLESRKFLFLCLVFHPVVFATTNVFFSNNTPYNYYASSQILDAQNLELGKDYQTTDSLSIDAFRSNTNILSFNSNINIKNGNEYHFQTTIYNASYPHEPLHFYITTRGLWTGSKIMETLLVFPSGEKVLLNPNENQTFFVPEWNNIMFHFIPFQKSESGVWWPSYVLTVDQNNSIEFDFSAANTFKAINYNVQLFPFYMDIAVRSNNKNERARNIPKLIGTRYDYVSLNEVLDRDLRTQIIGIMKKDYPYYVDAPGMEGANIMSGGVVTFSKWPILQVKQMVYQNCYIPECVANKGATYIKIQKTVNGVSKIYNVFSTHLQFQLASNKSPSNQARMKQIKELRDFIVAQNIPEAEPVLISGDLNIDKYSYNFEDYGNGYLQTPHEYLLSTLNAVSPVQTGLLYSYDGVLNTMLALNANTQTQLDYILYLNNHLQPVNAVNHIQTMRDTANPKMYPIYDTSDHFPVIGAFVF